MQSRISLGHLQKKIRDKAKLFEDNFDTVVKTEPEPSVQEDCENEEKLDDDQICSEPLSDNDQSYNDPSSLRRRGSNDSFQFQIIGEDLLENGVKQECAEISDFTDVQSHPVSSVEDMAPNSTQKLFVRTVQLMEDSFGPCQLLYDGVGYIYDRTRETNGIAYLRCGLKQCKGRGRTASPIVEGADLHETKAHNHPPNPYKWSILKLRRRLRMRSAEETTSFRQIYKEEAARFPEEVVKKVNLSKMRKSMYNSRKSVIPREEELLTMEETFTVQLVPGQIKGSQLVYDGVGFFYRSCAVGKNMAYMHCIKAKCHGRCKIPLPVQDGSIATITQDHSHPPDSSVLPVWQLRQKLRDRSSSELTDFRIIYEEECAKVPKEVAEQVDFKKAEYTMYKSRKTSSIPSVRRKPTNRPLSPDLQTRVVQLVPGQLRGTRLVYDGVGYFYRCCNLRRTIIYMHCIKPKCYGRCKIPLPLRDGSILTVTQNHCHPPDSSLLPIFKLKQRLKDRSNSEKTDLRKIFQEECAKVPKEVAEKVEFKKVESSMYDARNSSTPVVKRRKTKRSAQAESGESASKDEGEESQTEADLKELYEALDLSIVPSPTSAWDHDDSAEFSEELMNKTVSVRMRKAICKNCGTDNRKIEKQTYTIQIVQGQQNRSQLVFDGVGFFYHSGSVGKNTAYLNCIKPKCTGRCKVPLPVKDGATLTVTQNHTHAPDSSMLPVWKLRQKLRDRSCSELTDFKVIFDEECAKVPKEVADKVDYRKIESTMYLARRNSIPNVCRKPNNRAPSPDLEPQRAHIVQGKQASSQLIHDGVGFYYNIQKISYSKVYLLCVEAKCYGRCNTQVPLQDGSILTMTQRHNHPPDPTLPTVWTLKQRLKERSGSEATDLRTIYQEECARVPEEISKKVDFARVKSCLNKIRRNVVPTVPKKPAYYNESTTKEEPRVAQWVQGSKSISRVIHDGAGFFYKVQSISSSKVYILCVQAKCFGRANTPIPLNDGSILTMTQPHCHPPDITLLPVWELKQRLKERSASETTDLKTIFQEECAMFPEEVTKRVQFKKIVSSLFKIRRASNITCVVQRAEEPNTEQFEYEFDDAEGSGDLESTMTQNLEGSTPNLAESPSKKRKRDFEDSIQEDFRVAELIGKHKNAPRLIFDGEGYFYLPPLHQMSKMFAYLQCVDRECTATCKTALPIVQGSVLTNLGLHNHSPDFSYLEVIDLEDKMQAESDEESPVEDYESFLLNVPYEENLNVSEDEDFQDLSSEEQRPLHLDPLDLRTAQLVRGKKLNSHVVFDGVGYFYHCNRNGKSLSYLKCIKRACSGRCSAELPVVDGSKLTMTQPHNHPPDPSYLLVLQFKERIYDRTVNELTPLKRIYDEESARFPEEVSLEVGYKDVKSTMSKKRKTSLYVEPSDNTDSAEWCSD